MNDDFKTRSLTGIVSALVPAGADFLKVLPQELRPIPRLEPAITWATLVACAFACGLVLFVLPKPLLRADRGKWARWAVLWLVLSALGFIAYYELGLHLLSTSDETPILLDGAWALSMALLAVAFTIVGTSLPKGS